MQNIFTTILDSSSSRTSKAKNIAEIICQTKNYSWVGLYDVNPNGIKMIACSGDMPAFPEFPRDKGINGRAVTNKSVVLVNDVYNDPDYLTTFGKTQSELIIPVIDVKTGEVIGTIDVESRSKNTFDNDDVEFLNRCVTEINSIWNKE